MTKKSQIKNLTRITPLNLISKNMNIKMGTHLIIFM